MHRPHPLVTALLSAWASAASAETKRSLADEPYIFERLLSKFRFENDGTGQIHMRSRARVQTDAGVQTFATLPFRFNSAFERIELAVRVVKPDGKVAVVPQSDIHEITAAVARDVPMYSDARERHVTVPGLHAGDVLEWEVTWTLERPQLANHFWMKRSFVRNAVVEDERLEVDVPASREVARRSSAAVGEPHVTEAGGRRVLEWRHATSLDQTLREREEAARAVGLRLQGRGQRAPDVEVSSFSSWKELGDVWSALALPRAEPTPEIRARAAELTRGASSDRDKVQAIYESVSRDVRYVAVELGRGAIQPRPAGDTLATGYGDCKDKHTLLAALLRAVGIDTSPVLASSDAPLDPDVADPGLPDHVLTLVRLGKEEIWLDSTALAPFGFLSPELRGKKALVVEPGGASRLAAIPLTATVPNDVRFEATGRYDDTGHYRGRLRMTTCGDLEVGMRMATRLAPPGTHRTIAEKVLSSFGFDIVATEVKWSDPTALREPLVVEVDYAHPKPLNPSKPWTFDVYWKALALPSAKAGEPVALHGPSSVTVEMRIEVPPGRTVRAPDNAHIERDFAEFRATHAVEGNSLVSQSVLALRVPEISASRVDEYEAFRAEMSKAMRRSFMVERADKTEVKALVDAAHAANKEHRYAEAVDLLSKAVDRAPGHPKAWGSLGWTYNQLHRPEEAIPALEKQIAIAPRDPFAYNNLGLALRWLHRDADAERAFRKQIEVSPDDRYAHKNLGALLLETARPREAVTELDRAAGITPKDGDLHVRLGQAWLDLGDDARALAALDRAAQLSPTPHIWNGAAYLLATRGVQLDAAKRWAESAVAATAARLAALSPERATRDDVNLTRSLAAYWDTLGWVQFRRGDLDTAASYVEAAWDLAHLPTVADHLGQIREKQGRREEAARAYALAVAAGGAPDTASHLAIAAGGDDRAGSLLEAARTELARDRPVAELEAGPGAAEFLLVVTPGRGLEAATFEKGDEVLRGAREALRNIDLTFHFPDSRPTKLVRAARLTCSAQRACKLELPAR